jgi:hypothetical protein
MSKTRKMLEQWKAANAGASSSAKKLLTAIIDELERQAALLDRIEKSGLVAVADDAAKERGE